MGVYTYVSDQDIKNWSKVSDKELNELFQEARECDKSILISERVFTVSKWFKKSELTEYTLYHEEPAHDGSSYQARYQMCVGNTKKSIATYLFGIINGYHAYSRLVEQQKGANKY